MRENPYPDPISQWPPREQRDAHYWLDGGPFPPAGQWTTRTFPVSLESGRRYEIRWSHPLDADLLAGQGDSPLARALRLEPTLAELGYEVDHDATGRARGGLLPGAPGPVVVRRSALEPRDAIAAEARASGSASSGPASIGPGRAHVERWKLAMHMISHHGMPSAVVPSPAHPYLHREIHDQPGYDYHPLVSRKFSPELVEAALEALEAQL